MARPAGLEPATPRLGIWCSIRMSYGRHEVGYFNKKRGEDLLLIFCSSKSLCDCLTSLVFIKLDDRYETNTGRLSQLTVYGGFRPIAVIIQFYNLALDFDPFTSHYFAGLQKISALGGVLVTQHQKRLTICLYQ